MFFGYENGDFCDELKIERNPMRILPGGLSIDVRLISEKRGAQLEVSRDANGIHLSALPSPRLASFKSELEQSRSQRLRDVPESLLSALRACMYYRYWCDWPRSYSIKSRWRPIG